MDILEEPVSFVDIKHPGRAELGHPKKRSSLERLERHLVKPSSKFQFQIALGLLGRLTPLARAAICFLLQAFLTHAGTTISLFPRRPAARTLFRFGHSILRRAR